MGEGEERKKKGYGFKYLNGSKLLVYETVNSSWFTYNMLKMQCCY